MFDFIDIIIPQGGLVGTVTGMIGSFCIMSQASIGQPHTVTGGIAEALIVTASGLLIAILTLVPTTTLPIAPSVKWKKSHTTPRAMSWPSVATKRKSNALASAKIKKSGIVPSWRNFKARLTKSPDLLVLINANERVEHGRAVEIMDQARKPASR